VTPSSLMCRPFLMKIGSRSRSLVPGVRIPCATIPRFVSGPRNS
jgi:hypothetical protein